MAKSPTLAAYRSLKAGAHPGYKMARLLYCHPLTITPGLIALMAEEQKICRLDIPCST
jgi:tRNA A37 methylthiotransferase MiaB